MLFEEWRSERSEGVKTNDCVWSSEVQELQEFRH
jgi:hypothetical protein